MKNFLVSLIRKLNKFLSSFLEVGVMVFLCVFFAVAIFHNNRLADAFGYEFNVVKSGSMTPTINKFDFVVTYKVNPNTIKQGDIIVFFDDSGNYKILHRVKEVVFEDGEKFFITKGDYNKFADGGKRSVEDVYAKFGFKISGLGLIFVFLSSLQGISILIVNACNLMFMNIVWSKEEDNKALSEKEFKKIKSSALRKK